MCKGRNPNNAKGFKCKVCLFLTLLPYPLPEVGIVVLCIFSGSISNMKGHQIFDPQQLIL